MLRKKLTALLACVCILTSLAATSVSAYYTPTSSIATSCNDATWGSVKRVIVPDNNGGFAAWVTNPTQSNGYLPFGTGAFEAGTYSFSFDYLMCSNTTIQVNWANWAAVPLNSTGSTEGIWQHYESPQYTVSNNLTFSMWMVSGTCSVVFDNFKLYKDGQLVASNDYDTAKGLAYDGEKGWGYCPTEWWPTSFAPFYGLPSHDKVRVIKHGDGYAAWLRARSGSDEFWAWYKSVPLESEETYTVSYDYLLGDYYYNARVADYITWKQDWSWVTTDATTGTWQTNTITGITGKSATNMGFKMASGASMMIDNFKITDSSGNVVFEENFDLVPVLNGPDVYEVSEITISQDAGTVTASADIENSLPVDKSATLITAIYDGNTLLDVDLTTADIVCDPTEVNAVTTISHEVATADYVGKTFSAFLWDSLTGMNPLTGAKSVTIE